MKAKAFTAGFALLLLIALTITPTVWAQGPGQQTERENVPVQPVETISTDDLQVMDSTSDNCAVTVIDSPWTTLDPIDLGPVTVEGKSAGDIQAVQETDLEKVRLEYLWGTYWYNAGDIVTIAINWTPASSTLRIGLIQQESGLFAGCPT